MEQDTGFLTSSLGKQGDSSLASPLAIIMKPSTYTCENKFSDRGDIAAYAVNSLATLVKERLNAGSGDKLNLRANTTRAEAAVFLYRVYNKYPG